MAVEDRVGADAGKVGLSKESMYGTRDVASNWECDWQETRKKLGFRLGHSAKNLFHQEGHQISGMTQGDDFVLTRRAARLKECESKMRGVYPIKANIISHESTEKHQSIEKKVARVKARNCVSTRSQMCLCACERALT